MIVKICCLLLSLSLPMACSKKHNWLYQFSDSDCEVKFDVCPNGDCNLENPIESVETLEKCDKQCQEDERCRFFTYHDMTGLCQLKRHHITPYEDLPKNIENGKTSGVRGCTQLESIPEKKLPAQDLEQQEEPESEQLPVLESEIIHIDTDN